MNKKPNAGVLRAFLDNKETEGGHVRVFLFRTAMKRGTSLIRNLDSEHARLLFLKCVSSFQKREAGVFRIQVSYERGTPFHCSAKNRFDECLSYRGASLIRKRTPLRPYRRPMSRVLGGS